MRPIALALCVVAAVVLVGAAGAGARKIPKTKLSPEQRASHLLNRIGYGPRPGQIEAVLASGEAAYIEQQLHPQALDDSAVEKRLAALESIHMTSMELAALFPRPGVIQRLVREGVIDRAQLGGRPLQNPPTPEGDAAEMQTMQPGDGERIRRLGFNPIAYQIRRLPEPIQPPGPRGRSGPPIEGLNPAPVLVAQLQAAKMIRAVQSERQLLEVMTDFWFNHFNVFIGKPQARVLVTEYDREVIRPNALGKFRTLLCAVAHSPAMLAYLDNAQSVAPDSPLGRRQGSGLNENFARELMELHTLGVDGGYSQQDVTEAARILTGWTPAGARFGRPGARSATFLDMAHDQGEKTVLGVRFEAAGQQEGEKLLELLASHPSTARLLAAKLVRRFVADEPPAELVDQVARTYEKTDGDISEMLRVILYSKQFWSEDSYRAKAKKPLELVASTIRALDGDFEPTPQLLGLLERMGEPLYMCQPPTGYDDAAGSWLGSDQLVTRWNFALGAVIGRVPGVRASEAALRSDGTPEARLQVYAARFLQQELTDQDRTRLLAAASEVPDAALASLILGSPEFQRR